MKKRFLVGLTTVACVGLVGFLALEHVLSPAPGPTPENFRRLHYYMSEQRVLAILGPPTHKEETRNRGPVYVWVGEECTIRVYVVTYVDEDRPKGGACDGSMYPGGERESLIIWDGVDLTDKEIEYLRWSEQIEHLREAQGFIERLRHWVKL
jgi:hypothetical protein